MADVKRVYTFGNKEAEGNGKMRELLGGKGARSRGAGNAARATPCRARRWRPFQGLPKVRIRP